MSLLGTVVMLVCVLGLFVLLQPKVSSLIFPQKRAAIRAEFIQRVVADQYINPQVFWQFREFYSPGSFTFDPKYSEVAGVLKFTYPFRQSKIELLKFHSPYLDSYDAIIQKNLAEQYLQEAIQQPKQILFQDLRSIIYLDQSDEMRIIFVKPIEEMMQTNGFFDYDQKERDHMRGMLWMSETWVK